MSRYDFNAPRLFVEATLGARAEVDLTPEQMNYLVNVLRLEAGGRVLVFNGSDGEWVAELARKSRKSASLVVAEHRRPQDAGPDLHYLFAPLKHARLDYMVQKAVEMGASELMPVLTRRTQVARVNVDRMRANAIEAAEQCGILAVPTVREPVRLDEVIALWPRERRLVFCDEDAEVGDPVAALKAALPAHALPPPLAVLIGPEGGFDPAERESLKRIDGAIVLSLGPRILRADTAAVAALALVEAVLGDWRLPA